MAKTSDGRLAYADLLRVLSIAAVVGSPLSFGNHFARILSMR